MFMTDMKFYLAVSFTVASPRMGWKCVPDAISDKELVHTCLTQRAKEYMVS
jgi:hypothetical protein